MSSMRARRVGRSNRRRVIRRMSGRTWCRSSDAPVWPGWEAGPGGGSRGDDVGMSEDLAGRVLAAIDAVADLARTAPAGAWRADQYECCVVSDEAGAMIETGSLGYSDTRKALVRYVVAQQPAATLIRCEADRRTVERHSRVGQADWMDMGGSQAMIRRYCAGCGQAMPCPDLLDRAKVYGVEG